MPQHEHIDRHARRHGQRDDAAERERKYEARRSRRVAEYARGRGIRAKLHHQRRMKEKAEMKKTLALHEQRDAQARKPKDEGEDGGEGRVALPAYLLERDETTRARVLSKAVKQKRREKAAKWSVPIPKVRPPSDADVFSVMKSGKRKNKAWKRVLTLPCYVGEAYTRPNPKVERFIRPHALRYTDAHTVVPGMGTFKLPISGVRKSSSGSALHTQLGVLSRGALITVNVSDLGMTSTSGRVVVEKTAQITNRPENEGFVNARLLV